MEMCDSIKYVYYFAVVSHWVIYTVNSGMFNLMLSVLDMFAYVHTYMRNK